MLRYLLFWFIMMTCGALSIFIFQDLQCSYIAYVFSAGLKSSFCIFWTRALFKNGIVHKKNCAVDMHVTAVQYSAVRSESLQMSVCGGCRQWEESRVLEGNAGGLRRRLLVRSVDVIGVTCSPPFSESLHMND